MHFGGLRAPVFLVKDSCAWGLEFFLMVKEAVAEESDWIGRVCELVKKFPGGH